LDKIGGVAWGEVLREQTLDRAGLAILPEELIQDLRAAKWGPGDSIASISERRFSPLLDDLLDKAAESVVPFGPPAYHNSDHFQKVLDSTRQQMAVAAPSFPRGVQQSLFLAAAGHDWGHQGTTFRRDAPDDLVLLRADLGRNISTEMVSAIEYDRQLREADVPLGTRVHVAQLIDGTTFGVSGKGPQTETEKILACADVAPEPDFGSWMKSTFNVMYRERQAAPPPTTFDDWLTGRLEFLHYIDGAMTSEGQTLGWSGRVEGHRRRLQVDPLSREYRELQHQWESRAGTGGNGPRGQDGEIIERDAAILMTDLADSTRLFGTLGDHNAIRLLQRHFHLVADAVKAHQGSVVRLIGDAVMAVFDSSEQAFRAAMEIQRRQAEENRRLPHAVAVRIGIDAGRVYEGNFEGQTDFYGGFVTRAARARDYAMPGQIVMPQTALEKDTAAQVLDEDGFVVQSKNGDLKGFGNVPLYEITP
jgi:class 3 adenylate cyclase